MDALKSKIGAVAICKQGYTGLILQEKDGLYIGIHLGRLKLGKKWQSREPQVIGNIHEMVKMVGVN